jgi:hemerythrin-like metal-binding protein
VDRVTDLLLDYAEEHFFVEETLIESAGDTADHIHQHRNFSKNFNLMRLQRIGDPDSSPSRKTLIDTSDFLRKWIVSHIAIHDMAYVKKIFHSRNKETIFENWVNRLKKSDKMTITTNQLALYKAVIDDATIQR